MLRGLKFKSVGGRVAEMLDSNCPRVTIKNPAVELHGWRVGQVRGGCLVMTCLNGMTGLWELLFVPSDVPVSITQPVGRKTDVTDDPN